MANEWQIEAVNAEVLTRATPALQLEALTADVLTRATAPAMRVEALYLEVLTPAHATVVASDFVGWGMPI